MVSSGGPRPYTLVMVLSNTATNSTLGLVVGIKQTKSWQVHEHVTSPSRVPMFDASSSGRLWSVQVDKCAEDLQIRGIQIPDMWRNVQIKECLGL